MVAKTTTIAVALAAGLLALPAAAHDGKVQVLRGAPLAEASALSAAKGGAGVTVLRGPAVVTSVQPVVTRRSLHIDGLRISVDDLEPVGSSSGGSWFLDRSGSRPILVHCYSRQIAIVGAGRRILCDARRF